MAQIFHYGPYSSISTDLDPGFEEQWTFGPWDWGGFCVTITPTPIFPVGANRNLNLAVTSISSRVDPNGDRFIHATVRNVGSDPGKYQLFVGGVQP
jgi:hypothetical protein